MVISPPTSYGVQHDSWRPGQGEAVETILRSDKQLIALSAVTGSGKTGIVTALASELDTVRIATKARALQDQYASPVYGGKVLYGLAAYPCVLIPGLTAGECVHPAAMKDCSEYHRCPYIKAKNIMIESRKQVLSYAYWFTAGWLRGDSHPASLAFDEAHEIPGITMNHLSKDFDQQWAKRIRVRLPMFPRGARQAALQQVLKRWMKGVIEQLGEEIELLKEQRENGDGKLIRRMLALLSEQDELGRIFYQLQTRPKEMLVVINERDDFKVAPLSARMFSGFLSQHMYEKAVFASATIGDPNVFMRGIGFKKGDYDSIDIPSQFPPESMPVYVPPDSPKISFKSSDRELRKQSDIIAKIILDAPDDWSGFIHTASKRQSHAIKERLSSHPSLARRVWVPEPGSSSEKIEAWEKRKKSVPNLLAISWDFWTGIDAPDEEINIIAKVPFGTLDTLGKARMDFDPSFYKWEAACRVEQASGRHRRGEPEHYEEPGQPTRRICVIVDKNIWKVYNQFSKLYKKRINCVRGQDAIVRR